VETLSAARRSRVVMFTPGNRPGWIQTAPSAGADAVVCDLEDAVDWADKERARQVLSELIAGSPDPAGHWIRTNALGTRLCGDDLEVAVMSGAACVMLPKTESPDEVRAVDETLTELEHAAGRVPGSVALVPTIETPVGVVMCEEIARAAARLLTLQFGPADLSHALDLDLLDSSRELLYARSRLVIAARAAGLRAPLDGAFLGALEDLAGVERDSVASRRLGFGGRAVIHPSHVTPALEAYSRTAEADAWPSRVVEAFERAAATGVASIQVDGRFVDRAIYRWARARCGAERDACDECDVR
jgi:citrate lyase subunit beta / citryl-CoA lyase